MVKLVKALSEQQMQVINHVRAFRMTTNQAVEKAFELSSDSARGLIRRLRVAGILDEAQLLGRLSYFYLTKPSARRFYSNAKLGGSLGPLTLARQFGILSFCCLENELHQKITRPEFEAKFPDLLTPGIQHDYYFLHQSAAQSRLGYIYVDTGTDYQRIERKIRMKIIGKRRAEPAWRKVLSDSDSPAKGRFSIAIVTITPEKAERVRGFLEPQFPEIDLLFSVCPELANLL